MHVRVALEPARTNVISEYYVFAACEFYTETEKDLAAYSRSIHEKSLRLIFAGGPERCVFFFLFLSDLHLFCRRSGGSFTEVQSGNAQQECRQSSKEAQIWSQGFPEHPPGTKAPKRLYSASIRAQTSHADPKRSYPAVAITIATMFFIY